MPRRLMMAMTAEVLVVLALAIAVSSAAGQELRRRAVEVRVIEHDEFQWADAAIGALAGAGMVAVFAGVLVAGGRRRRSTR